MRPSILFRFAPAIFLILAVWPSCLAETTLIKAGRESVWKYLDKDAAPKPEWRVPEFDDSAWPSGPAPLGYGVSGLDTTLKYGPDANAKFTTAYFRHTFQVENPKTLSRLLFLIRVDDGAAVYLNGKEVVRHNLPTDEIKFATTASQPAEGADERLFHRFTSDASNLVAGKNTIAVEVHQWDGTSTDLYLDLILRSYNTGEEIRPVMSREAKEVAEAYRYKHFVGPELKIPDGYVDGGRSMKLEDDGHAISYREVLVVDRKRDAALQELIKYAQSDELKKLEPLDRVQRIALRVSAMCDLPERWVLQGTECLAREYASETVLIGETQKLCGSTVCRHRSLLLKILGDEAGLRMALVRGNYGGPGGAHAWNELHLEDGRRVVVDSMQLEKDIVLPLSRARRYLTVNNRPMYDPAADEPKKPEQSDKPEKPDKSEKPIKPE